MSREVRLPWLGTMAQVREMTGVEEDLFLDQKKMEDGRAINHTLANCTETIDFGDGGEAVKPQYEQVLNLLLPDRLTLVLAIREETFGPELHGTMKCTQCKK